MPPMQIIKKTFKKFYTCKQPCTILFNKKILCKSNKLVPSKWIVTREKKWKYNQSCHNVTAAKRILPIEIMQIWKYNRSCCNVYAA